MPKLPIISIVLMVIFFIMGTLVLFIDWPTGPAELDWGIWLFGYGGYVYVIAAAIFPCYHRPLSMSYLVIVILYFIVLLAFGAWANRRSKSTKDYFLAKGKLGPGTIGFSYSATQMSGSSFMGAVGGLSVFGYNFVHGAIASASAPWFTYILLGTRIRKIASRIKSVTLADIIGARYYSKYASMICTIIMLIAFVPLIAAQLNAAGLLFDVFLGVPYLTGLFVFGGIVILYTVLGGMYAVAWTDLIQGMIMIVGFAVLMPVAVSTAGGFVVMHQTYAEINPGAMSFTGKMSAGWVISALVAWGFFQIGGSPASVTRFLIAKDDKTLKQAMVYSILFQCFIFTSATLIGIAGGVLLPQLENHDLVIPTLISELLPPLLGGILVAAVLGAVMSTIDSILLLASSLVVENIYEPLNKDGFDQRKGLRIARYVTFSIGLLALLIAIKPPAAILWIMTMAASFLASAFTFPFLLGLWWPRVTKEGGITGMIAGAIGCVVWYVIGYMEYQSFSNWVGGIWPVMVGAAISLCCTILVSKLTAPPPAEVHKIFFEED